MTHLYDGAAARMLVDHILGNYIEEFEKLQAYIEERYNDVLQTL